MDKSFFNDMIHAIRVEDVATVIVSMGGVAMGRALFWVERRKRKPTFKEVLAEPVIIAAIGTMAAAGLALFNIESHIVVGGVSSLSGWVGIKSIDVIIEAIAKKMGISPCKIEADADVNIPNTD